MLTLDGMTNKITINNGESQVRFIRIKSRNPGGFLLSCFFFGGGFKDVRTIEITLK